MSHHYCSLCAHVWFDPTPPAEDRRGILRPCLSCEALREALLVKAAA